MRIDEQLELFLTALIEEFQERRPSDLDFSNLVDLSAPTQMYGLTLPAGTGVSCVIHVAHDPSGSSALARVLRFADREDLEAALERRAVTFGGNELPMRDVIPGEWTTDHSILEQAAIELARGAERPIEVEPGRFAVHGQRIVMTDPPGARWTAFYREPLPPLAEALRLLGRAHRSDQPSVTEALVESPRQAAIAAFAEPPLWFGDPPEPTPVETARGQTLTSNGDGGDHAWGGGQLVVGDGVRGRTLYGEYPLLQIDGPVDVGGGRMIPSISSDQYAATLARWFGVDEASLPAVTPSLNNFAIKDLGFLI